MSTPVGPHPVQALSAWIDGELQEDERRRVESHLASCASCRVLAEDLRLLAAAVPQVEAPPVPGSLAETIAARVARDASEGAPAPVVPIRTRRRWTWRMPVAAAATIAAVGLVVVLQRSSGPVRPPAATEPPPKTVASGAPDKDEATALETESPRAPSRPEKMERVRAAPAVAVDDEVLEEGTGESSVEAGARREDKKGFASAVPPAPLPPAREPARRDEGFAPMPKTAPAGAIEVGGERADAADRRSVAIECPSPARLDLDAPGWGGSASGAAAEVRAIVEPLGGRVVLDRDREVVAVEAPAVAWASIVRALDERGLPGIGRVASPGSSAGCFRLEISVASAPR